MDGTQVIHADEDALKAAIRHDELVLVDFWAAWCAPCRAMAPLLDRLATEFPDLRIVKVDAEAHEHLLDEYRVSSVPTLQIYRSGELADQLLGKVPYEIMRRTLANQAA